MLKNDIRAQGYSQEQKDNFVRLMKMNEGAVYHAITKWGFVNNDFDKDDYYQEIFLQAYLAFPSYGFGNFGSWLAKIAERSVAGFSRQHFCRHKSKVNSVDNVEKYDYLLDNDYQEDHIESLKRCINDLPGDLRHAAAVIMNAKSLSEASIEEGKYKEYYNVQLGKLRKYIRENKGRWFEGLIVCVIEETEQVKANRLRSGKASPLSKPILQIDKTGKIVKRWDCSADAIKAGFPKSSIERALHHYDKLCRHFYWRFAKEETDN